LTYERVCVVAGGLCIEGTGAYVSIDSGDRPDESLAGVVTLSRPDHDEELVFGTRTYAYELGHVLILAGESFAVEGSDLVGFEGERHFQLRGSNGAFECTYSGAGEHGACVGPTSLSW
jgi:hypothetical protein